MQRRHLMLAALASLGASGCAGTGSGSAFSRFSGARASEGVLYVYRPPAPGLSALSALIDIDAEPVARLIEREYVAFALPAGRHRVTHRWRASLLGNTEYEGRPIHASVEVLAGREHFLRVSVEGDAGARSVLAEAPWRWALRLVTAEQAEPELRACRQGERITRPV